MAEQTEAEKQVWSQLWHTPQAVAWEGLGWTRVVARYVRVLLAAEEPGATAALLSEARQLEDRLGLSPMSMLRLRWSIEEDERPNAMVVAVPDARWRDAAGSGERDA